MTLNDNIARHRTNCRFKKRAYSAAKIRIKNGNYCISGEKPIGNTASAVLRGRYYINSSTASGIVRTPPALRASLRHSFGKLKLSSSQAVLWLRTALLKRRSLFVFYCSSLGGAGLWRSHKTEEVTSSLQNSSGTTCQPSALLWKAKAFVVASSAVAPHCPLKEEEFVCILLLLIRRSRLVAKPQD